MALESEKGETMRLKTREAWLFGALMCAAMLVGGCGDDTLVDGGAEPVSLKLSPLPAAAGANVTMPPIAVAVVDASDATVTSATDLVTIAITANPSAGVLSGTVEVNAVNGVATFSDLSIDAAGAGYELAASSGTLTPATSTSFNVADVAAVGLVASVVGDILTIEATTSAAVSAPTYQWTVDPPSAAILGVPGDDYVQMRAIAADTVTITVTDTANGDASATIMAPITAASAADGGLADSCWPRTMADNGNTGQCPLVTPDGGAAKSAKPKSGATKGGVVTATNQATLLWSCDLGGPAMLEVPPTIGADGTIYVMRANDFSICAIASDGSGINWSTTEYYNTCALGKYMSQERVYAVKSDWSNFKHLLYCLSVTDGSAVWAAPYELGNPDQEGGGPQVVVGSDGTIYVGDLSGVLHAVKPADGTEKWALDLGSAIVGPVCLDRGGKLYVTGRDDLDKSWVWEVTDAVSSGSVTADFSPEDYAPEPGIIMEDFGTPACVVVDNPRVYVNAIRASDYSGLLYVFTPGLSMVKYCHVAPAPSQGTVVSRNMAAKNGTAYGAFLFLQALTPQGDVAWSQPCSAIGAPVILPDGSICVDLIDGRIMGFSPGAGDYSGVPGGTPLWQFLTGGGGNTPFAVSQDETTGDTTIIFGSRDGHVYAIDPRPATSATLVVSETALWFGGTQTAGCVDAADLRITNAGSGSLSWTATVSYTDGADWVSVDDVGDTCATGEWQEVGVTVSCPAGASPGEVYEADIVIAGTDVASSGPAGASPRSVHVTYRVGDDFYVDIGLGNDLTGDGSSGFPWKTITRAVTPANGTSGSVIHVAPGTYAPSLGETFPLDMWETAIVGDPASPGAVVIDGEAGRFADTVQKELPFVLRGVTVRDCSSDTGGASGGYIHAYSCVFENNQSTRIGGALWFDSGSARLPCRVQGCTFIGNHAVEAGGAFGSHTRLLVSNCRFIDNYVEDASQDPFEGGGGAVFANNVHIRDSVFVGNENRNSGDARGAAIIVSYADPVFIENCLLVGNLGTALSATCFNVTEVRNCTIADNDVGIECVTFRPEYPDLALIRITNSIVWSNGAANDLNTLGIDPSWDWITYSCVGNGVLDLATVDQSTGVGNIIIDPKFTEKTGGLPADITDDYYLDHEVGLESPCIDVGGQSASAAALDDKTTNPDGATTDTGAVDLGYHYTAP
jgi:outer membrane protein assembly factor BamB